MLEGNPTGNNNEFKEKLVNIEYKEREPYNEGELPYQLDKSQKISYVYCKKCRYKNNSNRNNCIKCRSFLDKEGSKKKIPRDLNRLNNNNDNNQMANDYCNFNACWCCFVFICIAVVAIIIVVIVVSASNSNQGTLN